MRYSREHKQRTRERIVQAAARRFRAWGGAGSGITTLMNELHLTHGGFYRHFASKEALFEEALRASVIEMGDRITAVAEAAPRGAELGAIVDAYLSERHCEHPERGCPLAALAGDIVRLPPAARTACHGILMSYAQRMARYLPGATRDQRERRAVILFSSMAGTLGFARTLGDRAGRSHLLADARAFHRRAVGR
jgi:TetR/AcrR family transcriptional regulator, transcriptional repressor for nem operon